MKGLRLFPALFPLFLLIPAPAQPAGPPHHGAVPRVEGEITIDGRLLEADWNRALVIELPFEVSPGENLPAPVRTQVLLMDDGRKLYAGFRAFDPRPDLIRAHLSDRDGAHRNDTVGLLLDPFHDGRRGFSFIANPLGVQMDATSSDLGGEGGMFGSASLAPAEDFSWDAIWEAAGRITAQGYEVELAIPFTSLRFPKGEREQTWGVIAFRAWPREVMHKIRSVPVDRNRNCFFCQAGTIGGLAGMTPGHNLEFDPTLTALREDTRHPLPAGPLRPGSVETQIGLSARWGVTPNLSLNAALNPDFSQVEADAVQVSFNRRFALFFPEKRPFFQEGADFFNTPLRAVYSRTVVDPAWGLKLTGKEGKNAVGAILARDAAPFLIVPGTEGSSSRELPGAVNSGVIRYRRDLGESSALGVLATHREGEGYRNTLLGVDGYLRLGPRDTLEFQALGTRSRTPESGDERDLSGIGGSLEFRHQTRDWRWWLESEGRGREFRADAGFVPRVGFRSSEAGLERSVWADGQAWFNRLRFGGEISRTEKAGGGLLEQYTEAYATYDGPLQSYLNIYGLLRQEAFAGSRFDTSGAGFFFNIRPTGDFTTSLEAACQWGVDYGASRRGRRWAVAPGITWNVNTHLYFQFDHTFERFTLGEDWLYRANLTKARLVYQFTVRLFARVILQRDDLDLNPTLAGEGANPHAENLSGQYLVSYKVNPQTLVYLGYSDTRRATRSYDRTLAGRSLFFKLGYAWLP